MTAVALFSGYSMDGIPELIERWLDARNDRFQYTLAELCDVEPRTVGRWLNEETIPGGEYIDKLAEALGVDPEDVKLAAKESKRRVKDHEKREGSAIRFIDARYVLTRNDKRRWREIVQKDESLSDDATAVLRTFTGYFVEDGALEVHINKEQLAEEWSNLTLEHIERVWPDLVESRYLVRRPLPGSGWTFWLQFPEGE